MKSIYFFLCSLLLATGLQAQEVLEAKHKLTDATVFLSGAQLTHEAQVSLKTGTTEVVLKGLANGLNPKSIQAAAPPEVVIVSAVYANNYLRPHENQPRAKLLNDSLELLGVQLLLLGNEKSVLEHEKTMILANQVMTGKETALTAEQLLKAADFYRTRLTDIYTLLHRNGQKSKDLSETIARINAQLQEEEYKRNLPSTDVVVTITCFQPRSFDLRINYFTTQGSWTPRYDLRAKNTSSPLQLDYRADVRQLTGIDWKQVMLTLSSGNPNVSGSKPDLSAWNLYVMDPYVYRESKKAKIYEYPAAAAPSTRSMEDAKLAEKDEESNYGFGDNNGLALFTQMTEATTTVEFAIKLAQDIPSDGKTHQVMIQSSEVPCSYRHFAVPKLDNDAFLMAQATGWEKLNLLPGPANIFFEGTYVGESFIQPDATTDTLDFSLGRDKKVVVTREEMQDRSENKFLGTQREKTFAYEITIRNTKTTAVKVTLEDQIPVSQDESIEVKLIEKSGASLEAETGLLKWEVEVKPAETIKLRLIYSVKHPKDKVVPGI